MSTRWTDTSAFPNATVIADTDLIPFADVSSAVGSRQRTLTIAALKGVVGSALFPVNAYAANRTLDVVTDFAAYARFTAAAVVTIPPDLPVGWNAVVGNATASDVVSLAAGSGVTILSPGVEVTNGKRVALHVVSANVVEAFGAFADEV